MIARRFARCSGNEGNAFQSVLYLPMLVLSLARIYEQSQQVPTTVLIGLCGFCNVSVMFYDARVEDGLDAIVHKS